MSGFVQTISNLWRRIWSILNAAVFEITLVHVAIVLAAWFLWPFVVAIFSGGFAKQV